jgi:nucleolar pre-ribosomal-associated protein 2
MLLHAQSLENMQNHGEIFDCLLLYLEKYFSPSDVQWSGHGHHLTADESGRAQAALAIMHMVIERWMPDIE